MYNTITNKINICSLLKILYVQTEISLIDDVSSTVIIINHNLTWSDHINVILSKTNKNICVIRSLAKSLF